MWPYVRTCVDDDVADNNIGADIQAKIDAEITVNNDATKRATKMQQLQQQQAEVQRIAQQQAEAQRIAQQHAEALAEAEALLKREQGCIVSFALLNLIAMRRSELYDLYAIVVIVVSPISS